MSRATSLAGLWVVAALAFTLFKLTITFGGNSNYLTAVLERVSLSGLANMTLATMAVSVIPMVAIWSVVTVVNPGASVRARKVSIWVLGFGLLLFNRIIPNIFIVMGVIGYFGVRFAQARAAKHKVSAVKRVNLIDWGRQNRLHQDIEMRALARAARGAASVDEKAQQELIAKIAAREEELTLPAELARIVALWGASSAFAIGLIVSPATVSATYMVLTTEGSQAAFMVRGPDDVLLIDAKTKTPRVWSTKDVLSWRLCGPSIDDEWWLLQPIGRSREDKNLPCQ